MQYFLFGFYRNKCRRKLNQRKIIGKRMDNDADFEVYKMIKQQWQQIPYEYLKIKPSGYNIGEILKLALLYSQQKCQ